MVIITNTCPYLPVIPPPHLIDVHSTLNACKHTTLGHLHPPALLGMLTKSQWCLFPVIPVTKILYFG